MHSHAQRDGSTMQKHHLDRRAAEIAEKGRQGDPDELLTTQEEADWLGVSRQWLEIGRSKGYGPPFVRVGPRHIRYVRRWTIKWLEERMHRCTAEYALLAALLCHLGRAAEMVALFDTAVLHFV